MDVISEPLPLTEEQVRSALEKSLGSKFNTKKDGLPGLDVKHLVTESIFRYTLESLIETRCVWVKTEKYDGKPIDGHENGPVPDVWQASVVPPGTLNEAEVTYLMPHSEEVHVCEICEGAGKVYCTKCSGNRRFSVAAINEKSTKKRKPCYKCKVSGKIKCRNCAGVGSFKSSLLLTVSWKKFSDHIYCGKSADELTAPRLAQVKGVVIKSDWGSRLLPLTDYTIPEVACNSKILHEKHKSSFPEGRIVEQRQTVEQIPVTVVNYGGNKRRSSCFVYGKEMQVFIPEVQPKAKFFQWIGWIGIAPCA